MDQSASVVVTTRAYGGSDSTEPSFNRPRYVRFNSNQDPKDLGVHNKLDTRIEGVIGSDSGSQTLFFRFTTSQPCRIGARLVPVNPYTDQYISLGLRNSASDYLPLGVDGFVGSSTYELQPVAVGNLGVLEAGYTIRGYWQAGYAAYDYAYIPRPGLASAGSGGTFASASATYLPGDTYLLTISNSQWAQLPFVVQLVTIPGKEIAGEATLPLEVRGRLSMRKLRGTTSVSLAPSATLGSFKTIPADPTQSVVADMRFEPRATLQRRSPFE